MRNHRRTRIRSWWLKWGSLILMGVLVCACFGIAAGLITYLVTKDNASPLEEPTITPHVVEILECWSQPGLLMVWSDGQVWRARSEKLEDLSDWTLLAHVRLGETP